MKYRIIKRDGYFYPQLGEKYWLLGKTEWRVIERRYKYNSKEPYFELWYGWHHGLPTQDEAESVINDYKIWVIENALKDAKIKIIKYV